MRGKIRTYCRVRPLLVTEEKQQRCVNQTSSSALKVLQQKEGTKKLHTFQFDHCFGENASQYEVFNELEPTISSVLEGYNVCVFAYGQTGSGKTYTMQGNHSLDGNGCGGLYQQTVQRLFTLMQQQQQFSSPSWNMSSCLTTSHRVLVSVYEVYNEAVYDLLASKENLRRTQLQTPPQPRFNTSMTSTHSPNTTGFGTPQKQQQQDPMHSKFNRLETKMVDGRCQIIDLTTIEASSCDSVITTLEQGLRHRVTNATQCNSVSSRSHCVVTLTVINTTTNHNTNNTTTTTTKLNLVDLAGSERISKSKAEDERRVETTNINKSLTTLGRVITSLSKNQNHTPYRDSKLTFLLQDSLSGSSKVAVVATVSPTVGSLQETLSTMKFASVVQKVELGETTRQQSHSSAASAPIPTNRQRASTLSADLMKHKDVRMDCNTSLLSTSAISSIVDNDELASTCSSLMGFQPLLGFPTTDSPQISPRSSSPGLSSVATSSQPPSPTHHKRMAHRYGHASVCP
eukprot:TRINITY_DN66679_c1_g5_i1.p1 TRINITY_DN66679_c1_g5~~TRINITY_DN66679_c1_g5_i1.p1  ORF type:complete len:572 (+),score=75.20 TRINITY_DN66679_c1_g5_i1:176-1717(+)